MRAWPLRRRTRREPRDRRADAGQTRQDRAGRIGRWPVSTTRALPDRLPDDVDPRGGERAPGRRSSTSSPRSFLRLRDRRAKGGDVPSPPSSARRAKFTAARSATSSRAATAQRSDQDTLARRSGDSGVRGGWQDHRASTAGAEYDEALAKALVLTRSSPRFELIETLRLEEGRYPRLERHLQRLRDSAAYFRFADPVAAARAALVAHAEGTAVGVHRVRLLTDRHGAVRIESAPHRDDGSNGERDVALAPSPVASDDPFLYHKTTPRHPRRRPCRVPGVLRRPPPQRARRADRVHPRQPRRGIGRWSLDAAPRRQPPGRDAAQRTARARRDRRAHLRHADLERPPRLVHQQPARVGAGPGDPALTAGLRQVVGRSSE